MTMAFATQQVVIPSGKGPKSIPSFATLSSTVREAAVALGGFRLAYGGEDHRIDACEITVERGPIQGTTVNFSVRCNFADQKANDSYSGSVSVTIIADVA